MSILKMTRQEFLEWSRNRAEEYLILGKVEAAYNSFSSDLQKHPETKNHPDLLLGLQMIMNEQLSTVEQMRKFLADFS
jgi:hypothetical protein